MDTFNNPFLELPKIGDLDQVTCSKEAVLIIGMMDHAVGTGIELNPLEQEVMLKENSDTA
jgi:hypothetical protein